MALQGFNGGTQAGKMISMDYAPGQAAGSSQSGQYFSDPALVGQLAGALGNNAQQAAAQYMPFVQNPTASPLFQTQLQGILSNPALIASRQGAQTNLADQFRNAGNMSSGAFANAAGRQASDFNAQDQSFAAQLLGQIFPQMTQALQQPQNLGEQLINAMKMSQSSSQAQRTGSSGGGGGGSDPNASARNGGTAAMPSYASAGGTRSVGGNQQPDPYQAMGYGPDGSMTLQQAMGYYSSNYPGSTYLGANGDYISGSGMNGTPWSPDAAQGGGGGGGVYAGGGAPDPWSFAADSAGVAGGGGSAIDYQSLYGNADGSMEY